MKLLRRLTMRQTILVAIPALSIVGWSLLLAVLHSEYWHAARNTYAEYQTRLFESFIQQNTITLRIADYAELRRRLNDLQLGPDEKYVAIVDAQNEILYMDLNRAADFDAFFNIWNRRKSAETGAVYGRLEQFPLRGRYFVFDLPIQNVATSQFFGRVVAFVSDHSFHQKEMAITRQLLLVGTLLLAIQLFVIFRVTRVIVAPLEQFVRQWVGHAEGTAELPTVPADAGTSYSWDLLRVSQAMGSIMAKQATAAAMGRFTSQIAHDMRNPLQVIKTYVKMSAEQVESDDLAKAANRCVTRLLVMADELLDYTKASRVEKAHCDIVHLCKTAIAEVQASAPANILFSYDGPPIVSVAVDSAKIGRVLTNMLVNATQAMKNGGNIDVHISHIPRGLQVAITDNGCGIAEEHLSRIFEPTFTFGKKSGTGLGLDYCKTVVEAHGGSISVGSHVGKGTTFTILLPSDGV